MEAAGAAKIVCRLFANEEDKCYISHSYQDMIKVLVCTIDDWSRYSNGQKKPNNGFLPLLHHVITFLADKGHQTRGYARVLFTEALKFKK
jgi:hypothetical protein